ncbi:MAG: hypothetical protein MHPSP_002369, partial [Paramarteilia canceri]
MTGIQDTETYMSRLIYLFFMWCFVSPDDFNLFGDKLIVPFRRVIDVLYKTPNQSIF